MRENSLDTYYRQISFEYQRILHASNEKTVELYSTDLFPSTGNVVGYHVNMPCKSCQSQPNSGHSWMFRNSAIKAQIIYLKCINNNNNNIFVYTCLGLNAIELPLLWGFVRETSGNFKTGDEEAARLSSQLSVHLSSFVYFFVHEPWPKRIFAVTYNDSNTHDEFILYSR
ncbi:uncharacterized protein BX663DRAFT_426497 [Cokeromyces recurvatus]|uniref:uncharacterized protein n=1 Tax=Cokeromyces recurvatus TaxID=90255 RepID=UPI00221EAFA4|nr:uncharacterized protein BX663DRAFT_426497 [Cokeromyces recurvatus]KAI7907325.1 hypothetical protein BX663DRAFT_426497 [Cokeromyces recurvatus]